MSNKERRKWAICYRAAMLELDRDKVMDRINEARQAVRERILHLENDPNHEERRAMEDALQNLRVLAKIER